MKQTSVYVDPAAKLSKSKYRQEFNLSKHEKEDIRQVGILFIMEQAEEIIRKKLENPIDDGRQTPFYGHPVFKAMHATATNSRKALFKWHRIPPVSSLDERDVQYVIRIVYKWLRKQMYMG